jgi:rSAM/selenodomain-associated transferase 1
MKADPAHRHLVIFARRPALGAGKRRLAREIGDLAALRFQRSSLRRLSQTLDQNSLWTLWLCLTPDQAPRTLFKRREIPQGAGDLGERLTRVMGRLPSGDVVVIGSDAPQISRADIRAAFRALGRRSAVFGPAPDGGFWLVALDQAARRRPPFSNVRWSTAHTLSDVIARHAPRSFEVLRELEDVDDAESLRRVAAAMRRRRS